MKYFLTLIQLWVGFLSICASYSTMGWIPVYMCQLSKSKYLDNSFCRIPTSIQKLRSNLKGSLGNG